jgi:transposase
LGPEALACMEMMSGAAWVRERLQAGGWTVQIADARRAKAVGSLAAKTDKLDARVLAELARRDLVPQVYVATFPDRELKERLGRRMHMIRLRTSAMNRAHGVLSQFGVKLAFDRLREPDALERLAERGVPEVWRRSVAETVAIVRVLDERLIPIEQELRPIAHADERVALLVTIPGIGDLLGLTIASEIGDISRFASARKLVGYSGLTPRVYQSGEKSRTGKLSKSGSTMLRWAAIEAAQQAWRPNNPWHQLYLDVKARCGGKGNPAKAAVARKVLIAAWHVLTLQQPFTPSRPRGSSCPGELQLRSGPLNGPQGIEQPGQLQPTRCARASAERELSSNRTHDPKDAPDRQRLDDTPFFKENATTLTTCPSATARRSSVACAPPGRSPTT